MNASTALLLRTNVRLLSLSVSSAMAGWFGFAVLMDKPVNALQSDAYRVLILTTGVAVMVCIRAMARRSFMAAIKGGFIDSACPDLDTGPIGKHCPNAWLVHLHLDLHAKRFP
jgi:hypothetical protein